MCLVLKTEFGRLDKEVYYRGMKDSEISEHIASLAGWKHENNALVKEFDFNNFMESMAFVNRIVPVAEEMGHHPDISIQYSKVTITLTTHDSGGVTQKDFDLAGRIDDLK
jgi:4a-hydroxytetrahydrobiopterin dehydratase